MKNDKGTNEQPSSKEGDLSSSIEVLLAEYQACNNGYNSRDAIVFHEFSVIVAIFSGLILSLIYITKEIDSESLLFSIYAVIGLVGLLSLLGITIDMQSTHSCKVSIRNRIVEIENELNYKNLFNEKGSKSIRLWSIAIEKRKTKYMLEKLSKFKTRENEEKEIELLNLGSYLIIILWIYVVYILVSHL